MTEVGGRGGFAGERGAEHLVHLLTVLPGSGADFRSDGVHDCHRHMVDGLRDGGAASGTGRRSGGECVDGCGRGGGRAWFVAGVVVCWLRMGWVLTGECGCGCLGAASVPGREWSRSAGGDHQGG